MQDKRHYSHKAKKKRDGFISSELKVRSRREARCQRKEDWRFPPNGLVGREELKMDEERITNNE